MDRGLTYKPGDLNDWPLRHDGPKDFFFCGSCGYRTAYLSVDQVRCRRCRACLPVPVGLDPDGVAAVALTLTARQRGR